MIKINFIFCISGSRVNVSRYGIICIFQFGKMNDSACDLYSKE